MAKNKYQSTTYANYAEHWKLANLALPDTANQQRRLVSHLLSHQQAVTLDINQACAIGNISDVAIKANKHLHRVGLYIGCVTPPRPILNRFNEDSRMCLWFVMVLPSPESSKEDPANNGR